MVAHLDLSVIILAVLATIGANADIKVVCDKHSVRITWRISAEMVPHAARLFLGTCMPSKLKVLPTGDGEALFNYQLSDCKFKKTMKGKSIFYQNEMTYRPFPKSKPATFVQPIECVFKRPDGWVPPFLIPGSGVSEGRSELIFYMTLLNEQLTAPAQTNIVPLGSFLPIWAAVDQTSHQPLLLLMEECVAASTPELQPGSQVYPIISKKGCLFESMRGNSLFLPRYHSSALILYLQSFKLSLGEEVYIHCKLVAWDPDGLNEEKKACHYMKDTGSWELLDDPSQSSICGCCDTTCKARSRRGAQRESHSFSHRSVLGPLIIVDPSDTKAHNSATGTVSQGNPV